VQRNAGGTGTVVHRGVDGSVVGGKAPDCGTHAKKPAFASKPELRSRAAGERKVTVGTRRRVSSAAWAWLYTRRQGPPEPRIAGAEWSAACAEEWRGRER
jgi:hypothetical protein